MTGNCRYNRTSGQIVNLSDVYDDERFDPTMDMQTGYRTKQLLGLPVYDRPGKVAGVLQLINTYNDVSFTEDDEVLAEMVADQIGAVLLTMRARLSNVEYTPLYKVRDPLRLRIKQALFAKNHNHLKCTLQVGAVSLGTVLLARMNSLYRRFCTAGCNWETLSLLNSHPLVACTDTCEDVTSIHGYNLMTWQFVICPRHVV